MAVTASKYARLDVSRSRLIAARSRWPRGRAGAARIGADCNFLRLRLTTRGQGTVYSPGGTYGARGGP